MSNKRVPDATLPTAGSPAALSAAEQAQLEALSQFPLPAAKSDTDPQRPAVLDDEMEYKTVIGGDLPSLTRPAAPPPTLPPEPEEVEYKTIMVSEPVAPAPAAAAPAPTAAPPGPPPVEEEEDEDEIRRKRMLAQFSKPPAPLPVTPAAPPPEPEEPVYQTIVLGGFVSAEPPKPPPPPEEPEYRTIIVDDSLLSGAPAAPAPAGSIFGTPPASAAPAAAIVTASGAPAATPRTNTGGDIFGVKTNSDGATMAAQTTSNERHNTGSTQTGATPTSSSWPGVTDGGGAAAAKYQGMPEAGMMMAQYEIIRKLGEGGMGAVYLARDTRLGRRVAIKILSTTSPELTKRFVIEARATARVEHENIVSIYEVGEWGGHPFMVLQFLQGSDLTKAIPRGKAMPVQRVVEIMTPVLRALAYAHGEGIVHRDLKPDNIFITDGGVTKVLDFGIAKVVQGDDKTSDGEGKVSAEDVAKLEGDKGMTRHGAIMGTMPFMSPEQWGNGVAIDHTTDIWAVGVMMYIMLSGKHPLYPLTGQELMVTGFIDEPTPSLAEHAPELPKAVIEVVDKCLKKVKAQRWPDAQALLRALEPLGRAQLAASGERPNFEESPYAGLSSFQEEDASRFFGRNREVAAMTQRLRERPLMAVVGPSGVGKSSFLRAGVVPALKNSGEQWEIHVIRPGRTPLLAAAGLLVQLSATATNLEEDLAVQQTIAARLAKEPGYLGTALRRQARREKKRILLFVDQFEELYTLVTDPAERLAFTACISAAADDSTSPMRVVVSIRSDFLDRCVEDGQFMNELSQGLFFMTAPTREGMREALVNPAQMAGYKFENDAIVNEMLDHLASTSGALPLLQFTADKLWGERDPTKKLLTEASYRALGGIGGALASHADRVLEQMAGESRSVVRALFLRLVTPDRTRAIVSMDELREALGKKGAGDVQSIIDQLVAARLLVVQTGGGGSGATVEIVHESLIHGWPQLTRWLDEGQEDSAFLEQMRNASRQWQAKNKDSGLLWRGEMVEEAKRFVRRFRGELPDYQAAFLKAVIDQSNRAARVRKIVLIASGAVLLGLLAAAAVALYIINESREETRLQAIAAKQSEVRATEAATEAEKQKEAAEIAKVAAEKALDEAKKAESAKEVARKAEREALELANKRKEEIAAALVEAQEAQKKAVAAAEEATQARTVAEAREKEATEARIAATKSAETARIALAESEALKAQALKEKAEALRKLKEKTGGVIEVLK